MMDRRSLMLDLIALTGRSASSLAAEIGINRSGVTHWLKHGGTSVGVKKQDELLFRLGVTSGSLAPDRVHRWTINHNLDPIREILAWVGEEFEEVVLIPREIQVKDWFPTSNLFLLYSSSKSIRILLRQKISPLIPAGASSLVNSTNLPLLKWFDIPKGTGIVDKLTSNPLLRISRNLFDKIWSEAPISLDEFDQILGLMGKIHPKGESPNKDSMTWEAFNKEMERRGILPEEALTIIDREKKGKS